MKYFNLFLFCFLKIVLAEDEENAFNPDIKLNFLISAGNENKTVIDVAKELGANIFVKTLEKEKLSDKLSGKGPFTIFAPSDQAFNSLPPLVIKYLKYHPRVLKQLLLYHVATNNITTDEMKNDQLLPTLCRKRLIRINIYPETNATTADGNRISKADHLANNGVVHLVDGVFYKVIPANIVKALSALWQFRFLNLALRYTSLKSKLSDDGPFTIFAPTDEAFKSLPRRVLHELFKNKTALLEVISYHIVNETCFTSGLVNGSLPTLQGESINVTIQNNDFIINNNANIIAGDIMATNGVIQPLSAVLIPPSSQFYTNKEQTLERHSLPNSFLNYILNYYSDEMKI